MLFSLRDSLLSSLAEVAASSCHYLPPVFPHPEDKTFFGEQFSSLLLVGFPFPVTLDTKLPGDLWNLSSLLKTQCPDRFGCSGVKRSSLSFVFKPLSCVQAFSCVQDLKNPNRRHPSLVWWLAKRVVPVLPPALLSLSHHSQRPLPPLCLGKQQLLREQQSSSLHSRYLFTKANTVLQLTESSAPTCLCCNGDHLWPSGSQLYPWLSFNACPIVVLGHNNLGLFLLFAKLASSAIQWPWLHAGGWFYPARLPLS